MCFFFFPLTPVAHSLADDFISLSAIVFPGPLDPPATASFFRPAPVFLLPFSLDSFSTLNFFSPRPNGCVWFFLLPFFTREFCPPYGQYAPLPFTPQCRRDVGLLFLTVKSRSTVTLYHAFFPMPQIRRCVFLFFHFRGAFVLSLKWGILFSSVMFSFPFLCGWAPFHFLPFLPFGGEGGLFPSPLKAFCRGFLDGLDFAYVFQHFFFWMSEKLETFFCFFPVDVTLSLRPPPLHLGISAQCALSSLRVTEILFVRPPRPSQRSPPLNFMFGKNIFRLTFRCYYKKHFRPFFLPVKFLIAGSRPFACNAFALSVAGMIPLPPPFLFVAPDLLFLFFPHFCQGPFF